MPRPPFRSARHVRGLLAGLSVLTLAGCSEYADRRETISVFGGDAVRTNVVTHVIDPWPRASANRTLRLSADRMIEANDRKAGANSQSTPTAAPGVSTK